ncbi:hypothetical protein [Methylobacterium durans]|uniref:DUF4148 domain-containing protein n=1 Tax=Methylobacterium durans TaxID=2202825 RepID=A0A2U8WAU4_9HYPH|nr:hypothetical protein [Methylobacterium durans]AWN42560.1 hypothetical protein DK389_21200 [Methylobacterium durans]
MSKHLTVIALTILSLGGNAWAHPRSTVQDGRIVEWGSRPASGRSTDPEATASILEGRTAGTVARDVQGRDLRSSTRGNAQFPERPYEAQNLGGTAGGPGF